jgi:hypothetical protein
VTIEVNSCSPQLFEPEAGQRGAGGAADFAAESDWPARAAIACPYTRWENSICARASSRQSGTTSITPGCWGGLGHARARSAERTGIGQRSGVREVVADVLADAVIGMATCGRVAIECRRLHWAAGYGLPRASTKLFAYRGDPLSRLLIDTRQADNIYPLTEQIRPLGRISLVQKVAWVIADAQIVREVLRDDRFRTVKQRDRSAFPIVQRIVAKTASDLLNLLDPPSMLVTDPAEHTRLRRLVSRVFTPRALDGVRARIHEVADGLLGDLEGTTECDLIADYTSRIPIEVNAELLSRTRCWAGCACAPPRAPNPQPH